MDEHAATPLANSRTGNAAKPRRRQGPLKSAWKRLRAPLAKSTLTKNLLASLIAGAVMFVYRTNRVAPGSDDPDTAIGAVTPAIGALWHGQHLLGPAVHPRDHEVVALFSRSADAELNALVAEKLGFRTVRGSGGRENAKTAEKGGARALIALKRTLDAGRNVAMIADIPHGTPRQAGLGIVTLAKLSGRPIVPIAIATSRRKVLEKTWDRTTVNLPFGRRALALGEPIHVPADADAALMEEKRREVTDALNAVTSRAYQLADGRR